MSFKQKVEKVADKNNFVEKYKSLQLFYVHFLHRKEN